MPIKLDLDPTITRTVIIAVLLFFQALFVPTLTTLLSSNDWPSLVQFTGFIIAALLITITYFLTFLKYGPTET